MPGRLEFEFSPTPEAAARRAGRPMRLLVLGDFSGTAPAERAPLAERKTHEVDIDRLDAVIARLAPRLRSVSDDAGEIEFEQIEDFHPDALYARLDLFKELRRARSQPPQGGDGLLAGLLGKPAGAAPTASAAADAHAPGLDAMIRRIVAPHIVADTSAQTKTYLQAVDAAIAEQMRRLLHEPAFQALESAWRGVHWLINSLELDENLQLHLFDATRDELLADIVGAQGKLAQTGLHRALADRWRNVPGAEPWTMICGLYAFGPGDADVGLLAALGLIASQAGGPFVATAGPSLATAAPATLAGWQALRASEAAPWVGLAAPRVLLRQPYGKGSDPISAFAFEEFAGEPEHESFLWGNAGLAVMLLIGRAFSSRGWEFEPGDEREIGELPAFSYLKDGEREMQACAEQFLGEERGNALLAAGLMPVMSHRHRNAVTVMRFQSVAEPPAGLAGLTRR